MASHSCFHKSVAKAMFSNLSRTEFLGVFRMLREFFFQLERLHSSECGIKLRGSSQTFFLSLKKDTLSLFASPFSSKSNENF